jgi:hypothetical protein
MSTPKMSEKLVALLVSKKPIATLIADVRHYVQSMTGNVHFPTPNPALSVVTAANNTLETSYDAAQLKTKGFAQKRNADLKALKIQLNLLAAYVVSIANQDPNNAENIILSAGMALKKHTPPQPKVFTVKQGKLSGSVNLDSKAQKRAFYIYQMTTDITNPASWVTIYNGTKVRFTKTGLAVGSHPYFRVAVVTVTGQGDFSLPVGIVVN